VARHLGVHSLPVVGHLPIACPVLRIYDLDFAPTECPSFDTRCLLGKYVPMPDTIQVKHGFAVLEDYIQDLLRECRGVMEEAEDCGLHRPKQESKGKIKRTPDCQPGSQNALNILWCWESACAQCSTDQFCELVVALRGVLTVS